MMKATPYPPLMEFDDGELTCNGAAVASFYDVTDFPCRDESQDNEFADELEATGRKLASAYNCHDDLLAALRRMLEESPFISDCDDCECGEYGNGRDEQGNVCEHIQARRAIAKANGVGV